MSKFNNVIESLMENSKKNKENVLFEVGQSIRVTKAYVVAGGNEYWTRGLFEVAGFSHSLGGRCLINIKDDKGNDEDIYQEYLDYMYRINCHRK